MKKSIKSKKRRIPIHIDMTPMVDIVILLLIFYMTATIFKPPEAKAIDLPYSHSQIELPDRNVITISVTKDESIFVDYLQKEEIEFEGRIMEQLQRVVWPVTADEVGIMISKARESTLNKAMIIIKADSGCKYGLIAAITRQLKEYGANRFLLITNNERKRQRE